jgi:hypothetical protein
VLLLLPLLLMPTTLLVVLLCMKTSATTRKTGMGLEEPPSGGILKRPTTTTPVRNEVRWYPMLQSGLLDRIQFHDQALFDDNPAWILSTEGQRDDLMTTTSPTVLVECLLPENWSLSERLRPDGIPDTTRSIMMKSESKIQIIMATMGSGNIESANGSGNGKGTARLPTAGRSEKK